MAFNLLFSPVNIGNIRLKNRIIFPPISTNLANPDGSVNESLIYHYSRRAEGGASLIILENMCISYPEGKSGATQPRIDDDIFIPGLSVISNSIHEFGSAAFLELTYPDVKDINLLSENELNDLAKKFAQAALRAKKAHFDGVEIEAAHGLFINKLLSPHTNKRKDNFGGDLENRSKFVKIIIDNIKDLCENNFPVTARIPTIDFVENGIDIEEGVEIAKLFEKFGYKALHADVGLGNKEKRLEPMQYPEGWRLFLSESLKNGGLKIPVIAVGMIRNPEFAENILKSGKADIIALGRALIADPDWPIKVQSGRIKELKRCIGCSECIRARHDEGTAIKCGINPNVGKIRSNEILIKTSISKRILIIGAGIAGLEAAITAKMRGHDVEIWEKENYIGGALRLAAVPPGKEKLNWLIEYYEYMINKLHINLKLNMEANLENIEKINPDAIIVATGSRCFFPSIKGINNKNVIPSRSILSGKIKIENSKVVIGGGGLVGCETALYLSEFGNDVTVVEMLPKLCPDIESLSRKHLLRELENHKIKQIVNSRIKEIREKSVISENAELPMDYFIVSFGGIPNDKIFEELEKKYETYIVGDSYKVGKIIDAVSQGYGIGKLI
ncbi:MAG: FAD-dependent oxidoreductase [Thermoplasmata archaeon]|nr:FAD-dependent oxidoreductase [Thermoplasmata archaeon]